MDRRLPWLLAVSLILVAGAASEGVCGPDPDDPDAPLGAGTWARVRDHVLPSQDEKAWCGIPWRASLWDAVIDANREAKPILLWAMNGHPLACT